MDLLDRAAVTYQLVLTKTDAVKPAALARKRAEVEARDRQAPCRLPGPARHQRCQRRRHRGIARVAGCPGDAGRRRAMKLPRLPFAWPRQSTGSDAADPCIHRLAAADRSVAPAPMFIFGPSNAEVHAEMFWRAGDRPGRMRGFAYGDRRCRRRRVAGRRHTGFARWSLPAHSGVRRLASRARSRRTSATGWSMSCHVSGCSMRPATI